MRKRTYTRLHVPTAMIQQDMTADELTKWQMLELMNEYNREAGLQRPVQWLYWTTDIID